MTQLMAMARKMINIGEMCIQITTALHLLIGKGKLSISEIGSKRLRDGLVFSAARGIRLPQFM